MKLKNVSFIENHFEKLIVALCALMLLGSAWVFLVGKPHAVQFNNQLRAPGEIDEQIANLAKALRADAESDDPPKDWPEQVAPISEDFRDRALDPVVPGDNPRFKHPLNATAQLPVRSGVPRDNIPYIEPTIPDPRMYAYAARIASLDPDAVRDYPPLEQHFSSEVGASSGVYDTPYVTLTARWDSLAIASEMIPKPASKQQIPAKQANLFAIIDQQVERMEARLDGTFPVEGDADYAALTQVLGDDLPVPLLDPETSDVMVSGFRDLPNVTDTPERVAVAEEVLKILKSGENIERLARRPFPEQLYEEWEPPLSQAQIDAQINRAKELEDLTAWFRQRQSEIDAAAKNVKTAESNRVRATNPNDIEKKDRLLKRAQMELDDLLDSQTLAENQARHKALTGNEYRLSKDGPALQPQPIFVDAPTADPASEDRDAQFRMILPDTNPYKINNYIFKRPDADIHYHDLTVEEGKRYRYRMRIRYLNPLYKLPDMPPEQAATHKTLFLRESGWTAWTGPIDVPRLSGYYVSKTNTPASATPRAELEVWRFYKGLWHTYAFTNVQPGSPIGHRVTINVWDPSTNNYTPTGVDFYANATLLDVLKPDDWVKPKPDAVVRVLEGDSNIVDRTLTGDAQDPTREKLLDEKTRLERAAQLPLAAGGR